MKSPILAKPEQWTTTLMITIAAIGASSIATYTMLRYQSEAKTITPAVSPTEKAPPKVAALGYLEPKDEVIKISAPAFAEGARIERLLVKRGDLLKTGQIIAILDSHPRLEAALKQAQSQLISANARLAQVKAGAKIGDIQAQDAKFQQSQAELTGQIITQKATIASLVAQLQGEKGAQQATIERLKAELNNAQTDCNRYGLLYENGAVSEQERDNNCLLAKTTQETLREGQANLSRIEMTLHEKINEAQANLNRIVSTQKRQIEQASATLDAVEEVRPVDVEVAQADVITAQAAIQKAEADLNLSYVRSPKTGQILKIHTWPGELVKDQGIVDLGQTSQMYVTAEVYETDIGRVQIGQPATIKIDRSLGELQGIVDEIGLQIGTKNILGTDPVADVDARVVEVKIRLNPEDSRKVSELTNLQVKVLINTTKAIQK
ncbi:ABC exporter membrane fusion protein [Aphanothece sacrum]|uniref:Hemolysin D n=1 Tax=Aphanothece sacrum FPU1 TaxID=1920663 RepID=A0A401IIC0_APHSA|nr:ABC exporter membrane fusion protein [Aphanothece sacrum]GBF80936.1 hemolysin D [Aphanothece sacrum FPU1]GBF85243.1 hemolysin D [Aphanothece sacrum FPU3]